MIPQTDVSWQTASWQELLASSVRDPEQLLEILELQGTEFAKTIERNPDFQLRVPLPYLARIEKGNPNDPLLLQVLPQTQEAMPQPGYSQDPVGDRASNIQPGLIHKYQGRALVMASGHCAINCRYCFRRAFPYAENRLDRDAMQGVIRYLAQDTSITEVILSGGDPLAISDRQLSWLVEELCAVDHLKRLRIHSRLPIVIPGRITDQALHWMTSGRLQPVVVVHCNHPNELDEQVLAAFDRLRAAGVMLFNQSVLLKGINDDVAVQVELCEKLFDGGVVPYYLHLLDKVQGAMHFDVSEGGAKLLIEKMRAQLPGYMVPKLAREVAGEASKTVIA